MFTDFLKLGFEHILDPNGYDHILFVIALAVVYQLRDWKKVLILVTAFTLGHSLTLALSAFSVVSVDAQFIETLIPITILITALFNVFSTSNEEKNINWNYLLALVFGLIHGLGFSNYFKAIMGKEESIIMPLAAFNIGVELGQIIVVILVLALGFLLTKFLKIKHKIWKNVVSAIIALWALYLLLV